MKWLKQQDVRPIFCRILSPAYSLFVQTCPNCRSEIETAPVPSAALNLAIDKFLTGDERQERQARIEAHKKLMHEQVGWLARTARGCR